VTAREFLQPTPHQRMTQEHTHKRHPPHHTPCTTDTTTQTECDKPATPTAAEEQPQQRQPSQKGVPRRRGRLNAAAMCGQCGPARQQLRQGADRKLPTSRRCKLRHNWMHHAPGAVGHGCGTESPRRMPDKCSTSNRPEPPTTSPRYRENVCGAERPRLLWGTTCRKCRKEKRLGRQPPPGRQTSETRRIPTKRYQPPGIQGGTADSGPQRPHHSMGYRIQSYSQGCHRANRVR
jgi:hypothetical protein